MLRSLASLMAIGIFAVVALGNQFAAMLMYWWFSLFRPQDFMWWDLSAYRLPLIAAALFFGWTIAANKLPKFDNGIAKLIGCYALLVVVSQILTQCDSWHALLYDHVLIIIFVSLATARQLTSARHVVILVLWAVLSFGLMASKAGWQALLGGGTLYSADLGGGTLNGSNAIALASAMCLFMLLGAFRAMKPHKGDDNGVSTLLTTSLTRIIRLGIPMTWFGLLALVITSESRGSALAASAGLIILTLVSANRIRNIALIGALAATFLVLLPNPEDYVGRLSSAFQEEEELDASAASRPHFWRIAMAMGADNPVGVGVGCYVTKYSAYDYSGGEFGRNRSVHSSHIGIVAELGYPGFILWIAIHLAVMRALWRARKLTKSKEKSDPEARAIFHLSTGLLIAQLVFIQGGSFYEMTYNDFTWLIFAMAIACSKLAAVYDESADNAERFDANKQEPGKAEEKPQKTKRYSSGTH